MTSVSGAGFPQPVQIRVAKQQPRWLAVAWAMEGCLTVATGMSNGGARFLPRLAVLVLALGTVASAQSDPGCGPAFEAMTAENIRGRYMALAASRDAVRDFHLSIPGDRSDEEGIARVRGCYARLSSFLETAARTGNAEAQFVLGHLLLKSYEIHLHTRNPTVAVMLESHKRGLEWLDRADRQGFAEATVSLIEQRGMLLRVRMIAFQSWRRAVQEWPWLPSTDSLIEWLVEARNRGFDLAGLQLAMARRQKGDRCEDAACVERSLLQTGELLEQWEADNPTAAETALKSASDGFPALGPDSAALRFSEKARANFQEARELLIKIDAAGQGSEPQDYALLGRLIIDFEMVEQSPAAYYAALKTLLFLQGRLDPGDFRIVVVEYHRRMDSWASVLPPGR